VFLNSDVREVEVLNFQKLLDSKQYVKETVYITREEAAKNFSEEIGEDFVEFLGYNPLPSLQLTLNSTPVTQIMTVLQ
jgi:cell division transport system permease protein